LIVPIAEIKRGIKVRNRPGFSMLPTFLGIGSARCASTWLYIKLHSHPDIALAPKEIDFFSIDILARNLAWYQGNLTRSIRFKRVPCAGIFHRRIAGSAKSA
jgi:hypothetical protein